MFSNVLSAFLIFVSISDLFEAIIEKKRCIQISKIIDLFMMVTTC